VDPDKINCEYDHGQIIDWAKTSFCTGP
jgi:hypothetical protein